TGRTSLAISLIAQGLWHHAWVLHTQRRARRLSFGVARPRAVESGDAWPTWAGFVVPAEASRTDTHRHGKVSRPALRVHIHLVAVFLMNVGCWSAGGSSGATSATPIRTTASSATPCVSRGNVICVGSGQPGDWFLVKALTHPRAERS